MKTEKEKILARELYDASDPVLMEERIRSRRLVWLFNQTLETESDLRRQLLNELPGTVGKGTYIEPTFRCDYGHNIEVGDGLFANFDCVILDVCKVKISKTAMWRRVFTSIPLPTRLMLSSVSKGRDLAGRSLSAITSGWAVGWSPFLGSL